tara:strand:- start:1375 stop:1668 length:294 start_codon:yes stop_codon:yes gene_type:complete
MSLISEIKELVKSNDLINQAKRGLDDILKNNSSSELNLPGADTIVEKLDSYSVVVNHDKTHVLRVRLNLFIKNHQVGYYDYETDFNGVFHDEYFVIK